MNNVHIYRPRPMFAALMTTGVLIGALALSGCGVKSVPSHPEGSTYPLVYPAATDAARPVPDATTTSPMRPGTQGVSPRSSSDSEYYNPPPPATEILAK